MTRYVYKSYFGKCEGMKSHFAILANGDMTTCCYDYDGHNAFGNITSNDIMEVLTSREANALREKLRRGILPTETCKLCFGSNSLGNYFLQQLYNLGQLIKIIP